MTINEFNKMSKKNQAEAMEFINIIGCELEAIELKNGAVVLNNDNFVKAVNF